MTEASDKSSDFMRLYMTHESKIRGYVLCMVNNWADADDILQEAVIVMYLDQGMVMAQVPPQARGFSIQTPQSTVTDFGTGQRLHCIDPATGETHSQYSYGNKCVNMC